MADLCQCGCGEVVVAGRKFRQGHYSRTSAAQAGYTARRQVVGMPNPDGLCACGCGEVTPRATENHPERGYYKGQHLRYVQGHHLKGKRGETTTGWKGGKARHQAGYIYVMFPEHPAATQDGYVLEHRLVMEEKLGRPLTKTERVHHINSIKTDNRPENLEVYATQGEHSRLHESQRRRAKAWERAIVAVLLDDAQLAKLRDYVKHHNRLPDTEGFML